MGNMLNNHIQYEQLMNDYYLELKACIFDKNGHRLQDNLENRQRLADVYNKYMELQKQYKLYNQDLQNIEINNHFVDDNDMV